MKLPHSNESTPGKDEATTTMLDNHHQRSSCDGDDCLVARKGRGPSSFGWLSVVVVVTMVVGAIVCTLSSAQSKAMQATQEEHTTRKTVKNDWMHSGLRPRQLQFGDDDGIPKEDKAPTSMIVIVDSNATTVPAKEDAWQDQDQQQQCVMDEAGNSISAGSELFPIYPEVNFVTPAWTNGVSIGDVGGGMIDYDSDAKDSNSNPGDFHTRTFDVVPNHTILEQGGVVFNVETVPEALPEHGVMARLSKKDLVEAVRQEAGKFHQPAGYPEPPIPNVTIEVLSALQDNAMVFAGGQGFLAACMMAFAYHLPLALAPDHLWAVITSGFAHHVDTHAEALRHHFVNHTGKVEIKIKEDSMLQGDSPPGQWEDLIFPKFVSEIGRHMNNTEVYELLVKSNFSTSTPSSQAASEITLMAAMKSYFEYTMDTSCGIPRIKLDGTRKDWVSLRDRTQRLAPWMMPNHPQGDLWIQTVVLPILDQFIDAYDGNVNYCFWQNMVKFRNTNDRSGAFGRLSSQQKSHYV